MTMKEGRHQLTGIVSLGKFCNDMCKITSKGTYHNKFVIFKFRNNLNT